ncbi:MAG TPA: radical SAM family heme chaperone HemW [Terriglobales bacterium]|nr:radical SAM family heme chaperone HemW [Terriglobales bacterium]
MPLGIYISVPFCKTKCSYCNFASGVFSRERMQGYVDRVCADIDSAPQLAEDAEGKFEGEADSVYLGGGTPSLLAPQQLEQIFAALHGTFDLRPRSEITVECAPGTISDDMLSALVSRGVNRVSLGVQSFVDEEARSVGRLHTCEVALRDIERLRSVGISNINVDLIAGLPHQTGESWQASLNTAVEIGVPHVSVYMLEIDEDSRLGSELLAGGARYHAHFVPEEETMVESYSHACERLQAAGIRQYEISNFAHSGMESTHNLKYWTRRSYFGFGADAHSMLLSVSNELAAVRLAWPDSLETYVPPDGRAQSLQIIPVDQAAAWEEAFFLGLRLNRGVNLREITSQFGAEANNHAREIIEELLPSGLVEFENDVLRLTPAGRLASNEVFERFLQPERAEAVSSKLA